MREIYNKFYIKMTLQSFNLNNVKFILSKSSLYYSRDSEKYLYNDILLNMHQIYT